MKLVKLGTIRADGSKIKANASKHSALSFGHGEELGKKLCAEVEELCRMASDAESQSGTPDLDIPAELQRRGERLAALRGEKVVRCTRIRHHQACHGISTVHPQGAG